VISSMDKFLEEIKEADIKHRVLVVKINKLYEENADPKQLYDIVRGIWRASKEKVETVEYVFGVYQSLIVAVYKPSRWIVCKDADGKIPRNETLTPKTKNRLFFVDDGFEQGLPPDENEKFYVNKSIAGIEKIRHAQNPVIYLNPKR